MKTPYPIEIKESISELQILKQKQKNIVYEKRVLCFLYLKLSKFKTRQELADNLGIHIRTQERWLVKYRTKGIDGLLANRPSNKVSKIITPEIHQGLDEKLKQSNNPLLGYWDAKEWVEKKYGVKITYHWLRKYMIDNFKTKLKSPRKSHYKKDEQAIEAFLKTS